MWSVQYMQHAGIALSSRVFSDTQLEMPELQQQMVPSFELKSEHAGAQNPQEVTPTGVVAMQQTGTTSDVVPAAPSTLAHA
jgi:hypothetical protein